MALEQSKTRERPILPVFALPKCIGRFGRTRQQLHNRTTQPVFDPFGTGCVARCGQLAIAEIQSHALGRGHEIEPMRMLVREILPDVPHAFCDQHAKFCTDRNCFRGNRVGTRQAFRLQAAFVVHGRPRINSVNRISSDGAAAPGLTVRAFPSDGR
jgi:hypothetical protein